MLAAQTGLLEAISSVYNVRKYIPSGVTTFTVSTVITIVATGIVDFVSTSLMFTFPALFVVGEAVAGATAATYIIIVGLAMISTLEALAIKFLNSEMNKEEINQFFKQKFTEDLRRYSDIKVSSRSDIERIKEQYIDT